MFYRIGSSFSILDYYNICSIIDDFMGLGCQEGMG